MDLSTIKNFRELRKMTQKELAEKACTCTTYISLIENNKVRPSLELLELIAKVLDCELDISFKFKVCRKEGIYGSVNRYNGPSRKGNGRKGGKIFDFYPGGRGIRYRHSEDQGDHRNDAGHNGSSDADVCKRSHQPPGQGDTGNRFEAQVWDGIYRLHGARLYYCGGNRRNCRDCSDRHRS